MRVAIVTERTSISLGGAERSVSELAYALSLLGHEVSILAAVGKAEAANVHVVCPQTTSKRVDFRMFSRCLQEHLTGNDYDIVHSVLPFDFADVYQPRGGTYAESIERNAASYENVLLRWWKRATAFANFRRTRLLRAERTLCQAQNGPAIAALSQYVAMQIEKHYKTPGRRVSVIPNGVRTDRSVDAKRAQRVRSQILSQLRIREQDAPVLFLFAANNFRLKGLAPLVQAMSVAAAHQPECNAVLVVAGRGRAAKYRRLARRCGMIEKIAFLGPVDNIQNLHSVIDVGILPTFYDPSSRFTLEVLAHGKPVVTTRYNGARDLFKNERHGIVIGEPTDISALANAIAFFSRRENIVRASEAIEQDDLNRSISIVRAARDLDQLYKSLADGDNA